MTIVSLACQLNKSLGDANPERTSVTLCIKGAMIRIPSGKASVEQSGERRSIPPSLRPTSKRQPRPTPFMDPKSSRLLGFGVNTITFLILGYFLGGFALNPILGLGPSCEGLAPCTGSVIGLFISALGSLGYTYYYFVKRV